MTELLTPGDRIPPVRIGLYGGAFDPPHLDHVRMAEAFARQFHLDRLIVLPTGGAWHKTRPVSPVAHRLAMTRLAFGALVLPVGCICSVDDRETRRTGPSYTHDTLLELRHELHPAQWYLLVGQDQFDRFTTWHRWQDVAQLATLVVAERPMLKSDGIVIDLKSGALASTHLAPHIPSHPLHWSSTGISSTFIRQSVQSAHADRPTNLQDMVQPAVASYISQHQLYSLHT